MAVKLEKLISGGQTGVDRGALDAALALNFPCGGVCPSGRLAEDGVIAQKYPLSEIAGGYRQRTLRNVLDSDATVIIYFGQAEGGTEQTLLFCIKHHKPYKLIDALELPPERAAASIGAFIEDRNIRVLNVAGPRASRVANATQYTERTFSLLLTSADLGLRHEEGRL